MRILVAAVVLVLWSGAPVVAEDTIPFDVPENDWGGAEPINPQKWFRYTDYPNAAVRKGEKGWVGVAFAIGIDGRISDCEVVRSSGFKTLDEVPCKVLTKRARFRPATDENGNAVATRGSTSMSFFTR